MTATIYTFPPPPQLKPELTDDDRVRKAVSYIARVSVPLAELVIKRIMEHERREEPPPN